MEKEDINVLRNRILNRLKESDLRRIDEVAEMLAEFLSSSGTVTRETLYGIDVIEETEKPE